MFFYKECIIDKIKKCQERIKSWGDVDICYNMYPDEPIVVPNLRIIGDPFTYKKYQEYQDARMIKQIRKERVYALKTNAQHHYYLLVLFCIS
ncbi:hypothetical protein BDC45DRAFT_515934 [Circinella umbellata]|nr:hypothetical protein BDC45DRAFT_515934 [Circinella umbellata]